MNWDQKVQKESQAFSLIRPLGPIGPIHPFQLQCFLIHFCTSHSCVEPYSHHSDYSLYILRVPCKPFHDTLAFPLLLHGPRALEPALYFAPFRCGNGAFVLSVASFRCTLRLYKIFTPYIHVLSNMLKDTTQRNSYRSCVSHVRRRTPPHSMRSGRPKRCRRRTWCGAGAPRGERPVCRSVLEDPTDLWSFQGAFGGAFWIYI